uniref:(northern house mosquito) hypothetical protein n=1 Tax=Culex pipiens TaxID=7175 RepID=A0A8D8CKI6_CULPI
MNEAVLRVPCIAFPGFLRFVRSLKVQRANRFKEWNVAVHAGRQSVNITNWLGQLNSYDTRKIRYRYERNGSICAENPNVVQIQVTAKGQVVIALKIRTEISHSDLEEPFRRIS